jgi:hypothetical protein
MSRTPETNSITEAKIIKPPAAVRAVLEWV